MGAALPVSEKDSPCAVSEGERDGAAGSASAETRVLSGGSAKGAGRELLCSVRTRGTVRGERPCEGRPFCGHGERGERLRGPAAPGCDAALSAAARRAEAVRGVPRRGCGLRTKAVWSAVLSCSEFIHLPYLVKTAKIASASGIGLLKVCCG